jgi:hypothetical protein
MLYSERSQYPYTYKLGEEHRQAQHFPELILALLLL